VWLHALHTAVPEHVSACKYCLLRVGHWVQPGECNCMAGSNRDVSILPRPLVHTAPAAAPCPAITCMHLTRLQVSSSFLLSMPLQSVLCMHAHWQAMQRSHCHLPLEFMTTAPTAYYCCCRGAARRAQHFQHARCAAAQQAAPGHGPHIQP
jgi:hypothetical protein